MTAFQDTAPEADPRKYVKLAAHLRRGIDDGTLRPGDPAPGITTLAAGHGGWARQTCAKALHLLEAEGLLFRVKGLGYYVTAASSRMGGRPQPAVPRMADQPRTLPEERSSSR